jgi:carboxypeptidase C (cathepsin A)
MKQSKLAATLRTLVLATLFVASASTRAAETPPTSTWRALRNIAVAGPRRFVTEHTDLINGQRVRYRAEVEETILKDADGKPTSSVFNTSYLRLDADAAKRPVLFIFNGGPGAASDALHLAAFGPRRMESFTPAAQADPRTRLIKNPESILDAADLVFIDPPETGFGRPLPGSDPTTFRGVDADSFAVGQFILHWLEEHRRFSSPRYIAGESYGGHRAVALARDLARANPAVTVDGLILISQALLYNGPVQTSVEHLPDPLYRAGRLQDAAALAWYHGKIDNKAQSLQQVVAEAREFTLKEWVPALLLGSRLARSDQERVATGLQALTGIPSSVYLATKLQIPDLRKELLRDRNEQLDQFDGRAIALPGAVGVEDRNRDWSAAFAGLTANLTKYEASELGVHGLEPYRSIVPDPYGFEDTWKYIKPPAPGLDVVLADELKSQPALRVLVPMGLFDTTSSAGGAELFFGKYDVGRDRITLRFYNGGHMLYADPDALRAFNKDIRAFVTGHTLVDGELPVVVPGR